MAPYIEVISRGILRFGSRILFCQNRKKGYFYLPGGHVEFGESARMALQREFVEEAGLTTKIGDLLAVSEASFRQGGKVRHEVNLVFHVELSGRGRSRVAPLIESREHDIAFAWMTPSEVRAADVRPASAKRLLSKTRSGPIRPECVFDSDFKDIQ